VSISRISLALSAIDSLLLSKANPLSFHKLAARNHSLYIAFPRLNTLLQLTLSS
jgi:hypothetical protein